MNKQATSDKSPINIGNEKTNKNNSTYNNAETSTSKKFRKTESIDKSKQNKDSLHKDKFEGQNKLKRYNNQYKNARMNTLDNIKPLELDHSNSFIHTDAKIIEQDSKSLSKNNQIRLNFKNPLRKNKNSDGTNVSKNRSNTKNTSAMNNNKYEINKNELDENMISVDNKSNLKQQIMKSFKTKMQLLKQNLKKDNELKKGNQNANISTISKVSLK